MAASKPEQSRFIGTRSVYQLRLVGDSCDVVPPCSIPNQAVKDVSADDTLVHASGKVGRCLIFVSQLGKLAP